MCGKGREAGERPRRAGGTSARTSVANLAERPRAALARVAEDRQALQAAEVIITSRVSDFVRQKRPSHSTRTACPEVANISILRHLLPLLLTPPPHPTSSLRTCC